MKTSARARPGTPVSRRGGRVQSGVRLHLISRLQEGGKVIVTRSAVFTVPGGGRERSDLAPGTGDWRLADVCHEQRTSVEL